MKLKKLNWPLIVLVAALLSLAGCKSDSDVGSAGSIGGDTLVFDADGDGIPDNEDSCPDTRNSGVDQDADGKDDACDTDITSDDIDNDGVLNNADNCPYVANEDQLNTDRDLFGDACDTDADGDGVADKTNNGDGTYTDILVADGGDNCPVDVNPDQADRDNDGIGDACDADIDGDGTLNGDDACPYVAGTDPALCDSAADSDGDGIPTLEDNCPTIANTGQTDIDGDGIGDACDVDMDGDGIEDKDPLLFQPLLLNGDNCPAVANADQADSDGDGLGDACDLIDDIAYACAVSGEQYEPMRANDLTVKASASADVTQCLSPLLGGLTCDVRFPENVTDDDLNNAATIQNSNVLGLSTVSLRVASTSGFAYPGQNVIGVSVAEAAQLVQLDLLSNGGLQVRTLLNGEIQEQTNGEIGADLDLLGLSGQLGGNEVGFLVFQTSKPFDAVEVVSGGFELLTLLDEFNVYAVCASKTEVLP